LRGTEFAFGVAHSPAQDWIELWCIAHSVSGLNFLNYTSWRNESGIYASLIHSGP
jgi:hypothetical protein